MADQKQPNTPNNPSPQNRRNLDGVRRQAEMERADEIAEELRGSKITTNQPSAENPDQPEVDTGDDAKQQEQAAPQKQNEYDYRYKPDIQPPKEPVPGGVAIPNPPKTKEAKEAPTGDEIPKAEERKRPLGEGANAVGKMTANAIGGLRNAGKSLAKGAMTAIRALGTLFVNPATAPAAWLVVLAIMIIGMITVVATGVFGASVQTPNGGGKSLPEYQPSYEVQGLLSKIIAQSNSNQVSEILTKDRDTIALALNQIETGLNDPKAAGFSNKDKALGLVAQLKTIVAGASTTDPKANLKLAEDFQNKIKELVACWSYSGVTLTDAVIPLNPKNITGYGGTFHWCTMLNKSNCGVSGHRSVLGIMENEQEKPITADAVDVTAPLGTKIYAPFEGDFTSEHAGVGYMLYGKPNGVSTIAVLLHCDSVNGQKGHVTKGQLFCKLSQKGTTGGHLHFELKVNGFDISRPPGSSYGEESSKSLWNTMVKILGNGAMPAEME